MLEPDITQELQDLADAMFDEELDSAIAQSAIIGVKFRSPLEERFADLWVKNFPNLDLTYEWVLHKGKRGRPMTIDFYHEAARVGIEINGGIYQEMGHSTGKGIQRDYRKAQICAAREILLFPLSADDVDEPQRLREVATTICKRINKEGV